MKLPQFLRTGADSPLDRIGLVCLLALPPALLHGRGIADMLISLLGLLFLLRSALGGGWGWVRQPWVAVAAAWFGWMVLTTWLVDGPGKPLGQAAVVVRLLLLVAACQNWLLLAPRTQRWFGFVFAACAAWIAIECWHQLLLGRNLLGYGIAPDGIITGPFGKERAGQFYLDVIFPGVLPFVLRGMDSTRPRDRVAGLALLALAAASMVLIGQRMPVLLLLLGLCVTGLLVRRLRLAVAAALLACVLMAALLPLLSPLTFERLVINFLAQMRHFWVSDYGQIYVRALGMTGDNLWLGLGYDGFRNHCLDPATLHGLAMVDVTDAEVKAAEGCNIHPHNHWLEVSTSFGLPGLGLFVLLVGLWLRGIRRPAPGVDTALHTSLVVAFVVLFWPIAARSSLFVVDSGGWAFLTAGWALAMSRRA